MAVPCARAGLHVRHGDVELGCRQASGERGVGVTVDEDDVGLLLEKDLLDALQGHRRLLAMRAGADLQVVLGVLDAQLAEEDPAHAVVVVLPRVHDDLVRVDGRQGAAHRRHLDELRPGADDGEDLHAWPDLWNALGSFLACRTVSG
jgi:hypothetical protein